MKHSSALLSLLLTLNLASAQTYSDRFVWLFGWGLNKDGDVEQLGSVIDAAGKAGLNGAVASFSLDTLCKQDADYFRRLAAVQARCEQNHLELIPAIFSVGYGGTALTHNRNLAEGLPVQDAPFVANADTAHFESPSNALFRNGGFEDFTGRQPAGFSLVEQPGEVAFKDTTVRHSGNTSLRLEDFTANPYGHGRVMQTVKVTPHRCYRVTLWVKTEQLQPANAFRTLVLAGERELAPREFHVEATSDWRKLSYLFNSLDREQVSIYAGLWGGKSGKVWLDDWSLEEVGPVNPLSRPGTPTSVRSAENSAVYESGRDFLPLVDPALQPFTDDKPAIALRLPKGTRIRPGEKLRVSWYHSMILHDSQVGVCMAEPELYEIFDHEAKLLAERLHPRRVLLSMDEIRMGGTCRACAGKNMAELLGSCITRQTEILRKHMPDLEVYVWSDMLDPNHNAHGNYYLVQGDYTGSWNYVPKNLSMAVWGGPPAPKSLQFFADHGFQTLVASYYDADDLTDVKGWLELGKRTKGVRGFMYTPWLKKYSLLPEFGELLR